jgi:hypothetical protein
MSGKTQLGEAGEGRLAKRTQAPTALSEKREVRAQAAGEIRHARGSSIGA